MKLETKFTPLSWVHQDLVVVDMPPKGKGVVTAESIKSGTTIVLYGGHVMSLEQECELDEKIKDYPHQIDDLFVIGPASVHEIQVSDYINHSCDPNCGFQGQIRLVTMRDIEKGEEITFDYAMVLSQSEHTLSAYELDCKCARANCRGKITANDWRLPDLQDRYKGYFQEYIVKKITFENRHRE